MKVALIGTTAACVLNFRADFIALLVQKGHTVYAFAIDYCPATRRGVVDLGAIPVDYQFSRGGMNPFGDVINTYKLSRQIKSIAPDMVFSYFAKPVVFGTLAAAFAGVRRRIGMLEGLGYAFTRCSNKPCMKRNVIILIQVALYRLALPLLSNLIFLNRDDPKDLLDRYRLKVKEVSILGGIGLNLQKYTYSKPPSSVVSFIFVGRLLAEKGVREYVAAARLVKLKYPEAKFFMLGDLDEANPGALSRGELTQLVHKGIVIHPGHVDDVRGWLKQSSVFVLPSYREGVPRSTQEAMAIGRPVITTDVPGCRDTVVDGENGFIIPPFSVPDLVDKMVFFIENPDRIEPMGLESYSMAKARFDAVKVNAKLVEYFN
ncbi:glycosyl transferase family 1 [Pseudomonas syringae]|uniref:Glycosyl transferase family 1 n=1 Tax=Pseudomonas syringae TaxID=317 RepID=A0A1C7Z8M2_PSESX|nr:glycosyltransferase family 4 protein [Pseudomonas syringae]OCR26291.1 glycosyl transferase family 1 [Pseudomonas syringae]